MKRDALDQHPATMASRVLLIEPNARLRPAVRTLLELEGHLVWPAPDIESGLATLRIARWPVVVLLSVSPASITRADVSSLLLRAVRAGGTSQWPQHAFLVATTSPEYLCAMLDWLPEGLTLSVLRQPYNVDQLLHTVALAAHSLQIMQESTLRFLSPRHTPRDGGLLPPLAMPASSAAASLAVFGSDADTKGTRPAGGERAVAASGAPAGEPSLLARDLRERIERLRTCAQQTRERLRRSRGIIEAGYLGHARLVATVDSWHA